MYRSQMTWWHPLLRPDHRADEYLACSSDLDYASTPFVLLSSTANLLGQLLARPVQSSLTNSFDYGCMTMVYT